VKPKPKLTSRQKAFLDKLLQLYRERSGPVHYSDVAERLGVNRFSAYDMLKVLEKKGFASSSYALRSATSAATSGPPGPGRSMIVFAPTSEATEALNTAADDPRLGDEWHSVRQRVLEKLGSAREANPREALSELLARLPEAHAPLTFCAEMIGALLLNMKRARTRAGDLSPFRILASLKAGGTAHLETLAGLSLGISLSDHDETNGSLTERLLAQIHRYQVNLNRLGEDSREALASFLEDALEALD
jgi:hypothetical protein